MYQLRRNSATSNSIKRQNYSTRDSFYTSKSNNKPPSKINLQSIVSPNLLQPTSYYFDHTYRKKYIQSLINNYLNYYPTTHKNQPANIKINTTLFVDPNKIQFNPLSQSKKQPISKSFVIPQQSCDKSMEEYHQRPQSQKKSRKYIKKSYHLNNSMVKSSLNQQKGQSSIRKIYENNFYIIYHSQKSILKEYKSYGLQLFKRQLNILKLQKIPFLWTKLSQNKLQRQKIKCLRQQLYKIVQQKKGQHYLFVIYPTKQYQQLFANNNQWLIDIIVELCKQFIALNDNIIHPKININNIYRKRQKQIYVDEWGCAGFKKSTNDKKQPIYNIQPIISSRGQWFALPQYLPPQILLDIDNNFQSCEMWASPTATNTWQLGCLIFEILTLIPLWLPQNCCISGDNKVRKGCLSSKIRMPCEILKLQKRFTINFRRLALKDRKIGNNQINPKIIRVMEMMLEIKPCNRIKPQQVIKILRS